MNGRLVHDAAFVGARELLETVAPALRPEEHRDFFDEAYRICKAMLEAYEIQASREAARLLKPGRN